MFLEQKYAEYDNNLVKTLDIKDKYNDPIKIALSYLFYKVMSTENGFDDMMKTQDNYLAGLFGDRYIRNYYRYLIKTKGANENKHLFAYIINSTSLEDLRAVLNRYLKYNFQESKVTDRFRVEDLSAKVLSVEKGDNVLLYRFGWALIRKYIKIKDINLDVFIDIDDDYMKEKVEDIDLKTRDELENYMMLKVYADINNLNMNIYTNNDDLSGKKFNKIYCEKDNQKSTKEPDEDKIIRENLDKDGIAVKIVKDYVLDASDFEYKHSREDDLKEKSLRSVISLPADIEYYNYAIFPKSTMEVYDTHKRQEEVMFVNAIDEYMEVRGYLYFSNENLDNIMHYMEEEIKNKSRLVPYKAIEDNGSSFLPFDYINVYVGNNKTIELENVAKIYRGFEGVRSQRKQDKEDEDSDNPGDYRSIAYSDLSNGIADYNKLQKVSLQKNMDEYILENGDLLINKNGSNTKVYMFEGDKDLRVLPDSNLVAIKIDREKAEPLFIKTYLESDTGLKMITNIAQSVATVRSININKLCKVPIPAVAKENQEKYVKEYKNKSKEIETLENEIKKLQDEYFK